MSQWQVLRAGRVSREALGYVHRGRGMSVQYSTVTTTSAAPDGSRTFCLSKEKLTLQQLNRRLALYMQQVLCLRVANQRLEHQIQEVLNRKCPRELEKMDGQLRTASMLQDQISECLTAQAHMKMQLLEAELNIFNFTARCEKERAHHEHLEKKLNNLRLQEKELKAEKLPKLQSLLHRQIQQLAELQMKQQQGMRGLVAQLSGGMTLKTAKSSDLVQKLDNLRQTSKNLFNRNKHRCWLDTQVSMLNSPEKHCDSSARSELQVQFKLEELRRTVASLEEEMTQLQAQNILLEASSSEQTESFNLQLLVLQQTAASLFRELDSVLQAAAQHSAQYQNLLEFKSQLETEMQDYRRLLDELNHNGCTAYGRQAPLDKPVWGQEENLRLTGVPRGACDVRQAPVVSTITIIQLPVTVQLPQRKHSNNSSENKSSDLIESLQMPMNKETKAPPKITTRGSMTMTGKMINKQSCSVASEMEINAAKGITFLVHDEIPPRVDDVQVQPETYNRSTIKIGLQANKTETNIKAELSKTRCGVKAELTVEPQTASTDPSKEGAAVLKTEMDNEVLHQTGLVQGKKRMPQRLGSPSETVKDTREVTVSSHKASASPLFRSSDGLVEILSELPMVDDKRNSSVLILDPSSALSDESNSKQNKILNTKHTRSATENNYFSGLDSNVKSISKTVSKEEKLEKVSKEKNCFLETLEVKVTPTVQHLHNLVGPESLLTTTESKYSTSLTDSGVELSSSDLEELPSPTENDVFLSPTKTCLTPEICPGLAEADELMSVTGQVFCPVDLEDHENDLSIKDPEEYLTPNDAEKCLGPVMTGASSSARGGADRDACLDQTKGKAEVRPVEKHITPTKKGQCLMISGEIALTEEDRSRTVKISVTEGDSLCFGSFEDNKSISFVGVGFKEPSCQSIIADKTEQLPIDAFHWKNIRDVSTNRDRIKNTISGRDKNNAHKETTSMGGGIDRHPESIAASSSDVAVGLAANFSGTITNSSGRDSSAECAVTADSTGLQGRFGPGSREWMVYGRGLRHKSILDSGASPNSEGAKEGPSVPTPARCFSETGRFGRRGSGEWYVYKSRLGSNNSQGGDSLPRDEEGQSLSVATNPSTANSAESRSSSKGESREWMVYGGSLQHTPGVQSGFKLTTTESEESSATSMLPASSQGKELVHSRISGGAMKMASYVKTSPNKELRRYCNHGSGKLVGNSNDSFSRDCKESLPTSENMATSPPATGRFGSGLNGEWRFYGRNFGFMSNLAGGKAKELVSSLTVVPRAEASGSGGNREWKDNGGNILYMSGAERVDVNESQNLSSCGTSTYRGLRLSSIGSGARLSSGSIVRRSRSAGSSGSGGKLSTSPSSHRISSSGKHIYSSLSGGRGSAGSARPPTGGRTANIQTASRPRGRTSATGDSSGGLSHSTNGRIRISSTGSMSQVRETDRITGSPRRGFSSSSGSGRVSSTGGNVINSSDWPKMSMGCGARGNKEKMSICKMAALSISAAGRERSLERQQPT